YNVLWKHIGIGHFKHFLGVESTAHLEMVGKTRRKFHHPNVEKWHPALHTVRHGSAVEITQVLHQEIIHFETEKGTEGIGLRIAGEVLRKYAAGVCGISQNT